jgi:ubiquinone biosynthesis monooxygenase Coq7
MLRVDHAGEYGAVAIYRGQRTVFDARQTDSDISAALREMEEGETAHLDAFDALLVDRGVRPTLLSPLWSIAGFGLGAATALLGPRAAMACTEAVEDVIEKHYAGQAEEIAQREPRLAELIAQFRADELAHKASAEAHGAKDAAGYRILTALIKSGCRIAIRMSERI